MRRQAHDNRRANQRSYCRNTFRAVRSKNPATVGRGKREDFEQVKRKNPRNREETGRTSRAQDHAR